MDNICDFGTYRIVKQLRRLRRVRTLNADSPEPLLLASQSMDIDEDSDQILDPYSLNGRLLFFLLHIYDKYHNCADLEGGRGSGPPPSEKSQKYRVS